MKTNYVYGAIVVVIIILGFVFLGKDDAAQTSEIATSTATSTIPSTSGTSSVKPSGTVTSPKPSTTKPVTPNPTAPGLPVAPAPGTPTYKVLDGSVLRLATYNGKAVGADTKYTLSFTGTTLSAKFCNGLGGEYVLDGAKISSSNLIGTKMYCATPDNLMEIETAFSTMLNFGSTISIAGNNIIITSADTVMSFSGFQN